MKSIVNKPWGSYQIIDQGENFVVKKIVVKPHCKLSLQSHKHRSEHWTITSGKPRITINKKKFFKNINETAFIPRGSIHRIENLFKAPVKIMEVQTGSILKETDIIRYKDVYGRVN